MKELIPDRFMRKVEVDANGCWLWTASTFRKGYAQYWHDGKIRRGHIVAYEWVNGPVPDGLQLDHLCRVRRCVNPEHLEPVTNRENSLRGAKGVLQTHCKHGHEYTASNTFLDRRGHRHCRTCKRVQGRENTRRWRARIRESVPVRITTGKHAGLVVWHTPEEYARYMKGVDGEAALALANRDDIELESAYAELEELAGEDDCDCFHEFAPEPREGK